MHIIFSCAPTLECTAVQILDSLESFLMSHVISSLELHLPVPKNGIFLKRFVLVCVGVCFGFMIDGIYMQAQNFCNNRMPHTILLV
jgi:hypothetical protein